MSLFKRLLGREEDHAGDPVEVARVALSQASTAEPAKAVKMLRREGRRRADLFSHGGELHAEFLQAVSRASGDGGALPAVRVLPWSTWPEPTCTDVLDELSATSEDLLYLTAPARRHVRDAMAEIEAMRMLRDDAAVAMVVLGEEDVLLRRGLVAHRSAVVHPDSEEVLQEFADAIARMGLKVVG